MNNRVSEAAKILCDFDGTLDSANKVLEQIDIIRGEIRKELVAITKELNAIEALGEYILQRRRELAHESGTVVKEIETLMTTNKQERVEAVLDAALAVVGEGIPIFGMQDIRRQLEKMRVDLGVSHPPAVVATILAADKRFQKTKRGFYEYIGREQKKKGKK